MERIKDDYDKNDEKVTADYLMSRCEIECKKLQRNGNYNVPSKEEEEEEEEEIIALALG